MFYLYFIYVMLRRGFYLYIFYIMRRRRFYLDIFHIMWRRGLWIIKKRRILFKNWLYFLLQSHIIFFWKFQNRFSFCIFWRIIILKVNFLWCFWWNSKILRMGNRIIINRRMRNICVIMLNKNWILMYTYRILSHCIWRRYSN